MRAILGPSLSRLPMSWPPAPVTVGSSNDMLAFGQLAAAAVNSTHRGSALRALDQLSFGGPVAGSRAGGDQHDIYVRRTWRDWSSPSGRARSRSGWHKEMSEVLRQAPRYQRLAYTGCLCLG